MYYRFVVLATCGLIFWASCRADLATVPVRLLSPGPQVAQLLTQDPEEGYFEKVSAADMTLQFYPVVFDTLVDTDFYRNWLGSILLPWTADARQRLQPMAESAVMAVEKRFPGLLPDSVYVALTNDQPYGPHIYFTRQNAIFVPKMEVVTAEDEALRTVLLHELFHLLSRYNPELRPDLYALANFTPAPDSLPLDALPHLSFLTNPDAPNNDYILQDAGNFYLPLLFAKAEAEDFTAAIDFAYFKLDSTGQNVTTERLADFKVMAAAEANSAYLIHPEEIMAEHFSLLFGETRGLKYPEELNDLEALLQSAARAKAGL